MDNISARKEAVEQFNRTLDDLKLLSDSATRFLSRNFDGDIYQFICARLGALAEDSLVIVNEFDPIKKVTILRALTGSQPEREKLASLLGRDPVGLELSFIEDARGKMFPGKLTKVEGSLFELSFQQLPQPLCLEIERQLGIGDIFAIPFAAGEDFLGMVAILTHLKVPRSGYGHDLPVRASAIEAFVGQAGMALKQAQVEAERERLLKQVETERALLELRVQERTQELVKANQELALEIASRKQAESQVHLQLTALEAAANGIVITDNQGIIVWCNPAFSQITSYSQEELVGYNPRLLKSGLHDRQYYQEMWGTILAGRVWRGETINRRKDGSLYTVDGTITPVLDENGAISHFISIKEDITEKKKAMADQAALAITNAHLVKDLQKTLAEEQAMRQQLIQAEKHTALSRMVASVAHEINNPLQTIKNCLYLSQQEIQAGPVVEYLEMATSEVRRIANLVSQLREIYRPTRVEPAQRLVLSKLLDEVHALLMPHLQYQQVEWQLTYPPEGTAVNVVADQLKQVFLNIALNAVEAMQPGGGSLAVSAVIQDQLATGNADEADKKVPNVGIVFRDTGPGITQENLTRIFEPFYTTKDTGTGLGLAICYDLVKRLNGQITVESQVGHGATFTVWLPIA